MKSFATAAILLALTASAIADDATALKGLTQCVSNSKGNIPYVNGWGLGLSTATTGRKLKQTAQNCADAAAISSAIPCTPQTSGTPTTPTTPTFSTPPTAGSAPGVSTTPSGIPTGTSGNPCGDTQNPVPWTGLLCTNGAVTSVIMSQLGPNIFRGSCDLSTLSDLAGLASLQVLDFTASGLSGSIPATWANGSWAGSLRSLTLAQNPNVTGPIPSFANLTALTSIDVSSSGLTGPIPLSSQGYPSLRSFVAVGNKLSGSLPASLPANLTTLNVGNNALNGTIPVYNSSVLGTFQVNNNSLTGCLPSQWASSLTNITNVDLSYNQLSGPIPSTWQAQGAFPTLQQINIVGNNLCGSLGSLGTPVAPVGQNNPNASRLVPNPGSLAACSGDVSCDDTDSTVASQARALYALNAYAPAPGPGNALAPDSAIRGQEAPALPVLPTDTTPAVQVTG